MPRRAQSATRVRVKCTRRTRRVRSPNPRESLSRALQPREGSLEGGIQPAHAPEQARESEQRIDVGCHHANALTDLSYRTHQRIELEWAQRLDVLQHRGLDGPELACDRVAVFGGFLHVAADTRADCCGLAHGARAERAYQLIIQDSVERSAGKRRDRIHGHVAPQLVPKVVTDTS